MVEPATLGRDFRLMIEGDDGKFVELTGASIDIESDGERIRSVRVECAPIDRQMIMVPAGHAMSMAATAHWPAWDWGDPIEPGPILPDFELCKQPSNQPPELAPNRKSRRADAAKQRRSRR